MQSSSGDGKREGEREWEEGEAMKNGRRRRGRRGVGSTLRREEEKRRKEKSCFSPELEVYLDQDRTRIWASLFSLGPQRQSRAEERTEGGGKGGRMEFGRKKRRAFIFVPPSNHHQGPRKSIFISSSTLKSISLKQDGLQPTRRRDDGKGGGLKEGRGESQTKPPPPCSLSKNERLQKLRTQVV